MKFYQHWIGDYQKATKRLSMLEHGAYRLLMDEYYSTEKPLPSDPMQLHRICMAFAHDEQAALHGVLERYFILTEDGWIHGRIESEIEKATQVSEKRRLAAEKRWKMEQKRDASAYAKAHANDMQNGCYPQSQSQSHKGKEETIPYSGIVGAYNKFCPSLPKAKEVTTKRRTAIRLRWNKYQKHEGGAVTVFDTLFKKAEASDFLSGRNGKWSNCNLDWLLKEENMVKVIEGNYDNERVVSERRPQFAPSKAGAAHLALEEVERRFREQASLDRRNRDGWTQKTGSDGLALLPPGGEQENDP